MRRPQEIRCFEIALLAGILCSQVLFGQTNQLEIVYPREDATIVTRDSAFVYGYYHPDGLRIRINGIAASQFDGNRFLAVVPVTPGRFTFLAQAFLGADSLLRPVVERERHIYIPHYLATSPPAPLIIDTSLIYPHNDLTLRPGDLLGLAFKGSLGAKAYCMIEGVTRIIRMEEDAGRKRALWKEDVFGKNLPTSMPEVTGVYTATFQIPPNFSFHNAKLHFTLFNETGEQVECLAPGRLTVVQESQYRRVRLTRDFSFGRKIDRRHGELVTLPAGTVLPFLGSDGDEYASEVADFGNVWMPRDVAEVLIDSSQIMLRTIHAISTVTAIHSTQIRISLDARLPFRVQQTINPPKLDIYIHGVKQPPDIDESQLDPQTVKGIHSSRAGDETVRLRLQLKQKRWWGFHTGYEGNDLIISVRRPPVVANSVLHDLIVCLDPGHGPDPGAIGATGTSERERNLLMASALRDELQARGSHVIMTRAGESGITLDARRLFAEASQADVFISIHHNSLPDGFNPLSRRGTGVYYFLPQSEELAEFVFRYLHETTNLPKFGLFHNNFAVCRTTGMPAILVETAFLTHPDDELLIMDAIVRQQAVTAIAQGLEAFFRNALQED